MGGYLVMQKLLCLFVIVTFSGLLFLIGGCSEEKADPVSTSDNSLILDNDLGGTKSPASNVPKSVISEVGKTFTVSLESNPTTGYSWTAEVDSEFLKVADETFKSDSNLIGAGGVQTFEFEALKTGQTKMTMKYMRPWENEAINKYEIAVTINPKA